MGYFVGEDITDEFGKKAYCEVTAESFVIVLDDARQIRLNFDNMMKLHAAIELAIACEGVTN